MITTRLCLILAALSLTPTMAWAQPPPADPAESKPLGGVPGIADKASLDRFEALAKERGRGEKAEESAREKIEVLKGDKREAEFTVAEVRNGKLIQYGISGGVAIGIHIPAKVSGWTGIETAEAAVVPYLVFLPGYWGPSDAENAYCASQWSGTSFAEATKAAMAKGQARAELKLDVVAAHVRNYGATCPSGGDEETNWCKKLDVDDTNVARVNAWINETDAAKKEALRNDLLAVLSTKDTWIPTQGANCWLRKVGIWVGRPTNYNAEAYFADVNRGGRRDVSPVVGFGLALVPNAYISGLIGVTYGTARAEPPDENSTEALWSITTALGGNLDIFTLLTK